MKPYVAFLQDLDRVTELASHYSRFSKLFYGTERGVNEDFANFFEGKSCDKKPTAICESYVAEQFDPYAIEYFRLRAHDDRRNVRLVQYKFFPTSHHLAGC